MEPSQHYQINHSIYCKRNKTGLIDVMNADHYLMGEYNERTGTVTWQRLIAAPQRVTIERWLVENFPVVKPVRPASEKAPKREARPQRKHQTA